MIEVTFSARCKIKEGRKLTERFFTWTELHKTESDARLRALALNWEIVKIQHIA